MKKYRLKKWYPSLYDDIEVGTIVDYEDGWIYYINKRGNKTTVEIDEWELSHKDFWELIEEEKPPIANAMLVAGGSDAGVLKRFMIEFFPFTELRKAGFFTKEMKGDYYAQAKRVCDFFGYKSVFEYGAEEIRCHLSHVGERPENDKEFITIIPSIYD